MSIGNVSRRDLLIGAASAAVGVASSRAFSATASLAGQPGGSFRFAHLTDLHMRHRKSSKSVHRAIQHALDQNPKPQMIATGGDLVYDSGRASEHDVRKQWATFRRAFPLDLPVPVEHIVGNHDIWGIDRDASGTTGKEPLYGKKWALEVLQLERAYRSFDKGGWHWVLLDDVIALPETKTYEARLDEEQFDWLSSDLQGVKPGTPVIVLTHVPILGASVFFPPQTTHKGVWSLPFTMMHGDAGRIIALFEQHPNVKLCLSGHTHLVDKVEYKGVTYLCNGAVCGAWWAGAFQGFEPGYSLVDLYPDGQFSSKFVTYEA